MAIYKEMGSGDRNREISFFQAYGQTSKMDKRTVYLGGHNMRPDGTVFVDQAEILASCHGVLKFVPPIYRKIYVADSLAVLGNTQTFLE